MPHEKRSQKLAIVLLTFTLVTVLEKKFLEMLKLVRLGKLVRITRMLKMGIRMRICEKFCKSSLYLILYDHSKKICSSIAQLRK